MRITIRCPICSSRSVARTSRELSPTLREISYRCENDECGHIYIAALEVVRTIVPSALHNPDVHVPLSPHSNAARSTSRAVVGSPPTSR